jgi:maltodextrin utilization protein YvdJ
MRNAVDNPLEGTENKKAQRRNTYCTAAQSSLSSQQSAQDLINQNWLYQYHQIHFR